MRWMSLSAALVLALGAVGCGNDGSPPPSSDAGSDASTPDSSTVDGSTVDGSTPDGSTVDASTPPDTCQNAQQDGKETDQVPYDADRMNTAEPVYETMPGWKSKTVGISNPDDLPPRAMHATGSWR